MEASAAEVVVTGLFGAVIGSFLNVVAHRVPLGESLVSPGSHCPHCGAPVKPYDNVPVVSWLLLRGRCRNCGEPISAALSARRARSRRSCSRPWWPRAASTTTWCSSCRSWRCLIALAAIDLDHRLLPNKIVYPMAA